jgi:hypothetical protein
MIYFYVFPFLEILTNFFSHVLPLDPTFSSYVDSNFNIFSEKNYFLVFLQVLMSFLRVFCWVYESLMSVFCGFYGFFMRWCHLAETSGNFLESSSHLAEFSTHIPESSIDLSGFSRIFRGFFIDFLLFF